MVFTGESFCSVGYRGNSRSWMCMSNGGVIPAALGVFAGGRWMVYSSTVCDTCVVARIYDGKSDKCHLSLQC